MPVDFSEINVSLSQVETTKIITDPIYMDEMNAGDISMRFDMVEGKETNIVTMSEMDAPLRTANGCDLPIATGSTASARYMKVSPLGFEMRYCKDILRNTVLELAARNGLRENDITNTELGNIVFELTRSAVKKQLVNISWFGDKASADPEINMVDGWWKYIQAAVTSNETPRTSTYTNTPLGAGDGVQILKDVMRNATLELRGLGEMDKIFYASESVQFALEDDVENGLLNTSLYRTEIENGRPVTRFKNIEIRYMKEWGALANTYFNQTDANLVVLTKKRNLVMGTGADANIFDLFYSRDLMRTILRYKSVHGLQIERPSLISVAY